MIEYILPGLLAAGAIAYAVKVFNDRGGEIKPLPRVLVHSINPDLCIGCGKCVAVCPKDVLELDPQTHKSRVARQDDCIQCQQCMVVCPTPNKALVMHREGDQPDPIQVPDLDEHYQSRKFPGLYLIGEAAGKPMIKNGVNLGRAAVEHMRLRGGLVALASRPRRPPPLLDTQDVDVLIVGAGPAGLSAGMTCLQRGLSYVVLERKDSAMATVMSYPAGKAVHANPEEVRCVGLLPVWDCTPAALQAEWKRTLDAVGLSVRLEVEVRRIVHDEAAGSYLVETNGKGAYRAQRVVLALGGSQPRSLGRDGDLPGEHLVERSPEKSDSCEDQTVLVVGGGDSAVETALNLARRRNQVLLSYHGKQDKLRANQKNLDKLKQAARERSIQPLYESRVLAFTGKKTEIERKNSQGQVVQERVPTDKVFACIGGDPPKRWLETRIEGRSAPAQDGKGGIHFVKEPHQSRRPPTDRLVEELIGEQMPNDRPGPGDGPLFQRWLEVRLGRSGVPPRTTPDAVTIRMTAEHFRMRMPDKADVKELEKRAGHPLLTIRELRQRSGH